MKSNTKLFLRKSREVWPLLLTFSETPKSLSRGGSLAQQSVRKPKSSHAEK